MVSSHCPWLNHIGSFRSCTAASSCTSQEHILYSHILLYHSSSSSTQHTHPLERTPVPHHKGCVLVVFLVFLQHFCLLLCLTVAARHAFLQQTTCHFPQHPYSQDKPPECLVKALGLFFFSSLPVLFFLVIRIIFALCFCRATDKEGWFDSGSECFCMWVSHKWSLLEPE